MASSATDPPSHMSRQLRFSFTSRSFYLPSRYFIYYILISSGSYFSTSLTCITSRSSGHLAPLPFAEGRYATRNVSRCGIIYHTSQCIHNTIHIIFLNSKCQILKTNFLSMFALHNFVQYGGGLPLFFFGSTYCTIFIIIIWHRQDCHQAKTDCQMHTPTHFSDSPRAPVAAPNIVAISRSSCLN